MAYSTIGLGPTIKGATGAGMNILPFILALAPSLLSAIFGKKGTTTATQTTETEPRGYQSPIIGAMEPMIAQSLAGNMKRFSGMGFPKGQGLSTSLADQIISLLGEEGTNVIDRYRNASNPVAPAPKSQAVQDCERACMNQYGAQGSEKVKLCQKNCAQIRG